jgi:hypothetical protein
MQLIRLLVFAAFSAFLMGVPASALRAQTMTKLIAARIPKNAALTDPRASFWKSIPARAIEMQPQNITTPADPQPAVTQLTVRVAHNGEKIAFLLEWADKEKDDRLAVDKFSDQVAVELPAHYDAKSLPSPMMGDADNMVTIMQWRAAFQRDIDKGVPNVKDFYPNANIDLYPDQVLLATDARSYTGAMAVDSPMPHAQASPVLDQMAKGFGSLTVKPDQNASGKGVWANGKWRVVIARPMKATKEIDPNLAPGIQTVVAFAVWEGAAREVGSRKSWADWIPLALAK